jgi:hypothetical protein
MTFPFKTFFTRGSQVPVTPAVSNDKTTKDIPYLRKAIPTRSLTDQNNPHKYVPAANTDVRRHR